VPGVDGSAALRDELGDHARVGLDEARGVECPGVVPTRPVVGAVEVEQDPLVFATVCPEPPSLMPDTNRWISSWSVVVRVSSVMVEWYPTWRICHPARGRLKLSTFPFIPHL